LTGVRCECFVVGATKKDLEETGVVLHCVLTELHKVSFCHYLHQQCHVVEIEHKRTSWHHVLLLCFALVFFWPLQLFCVFLVLQMSMLMLLCELWLWLCTYAGRMTTILEVQDEIHKVQGELEELRKRLQEEVPEAERAHLWKKEELLMKEKEQLRQKELLLMQSGQNSTALVQQAGHNNNSLVQQPAQNTPISSTFSLPLQFAKPVCVPQLDLASIFDVLCSLMTACCW